MIVVARAHPGEGDESSSASPSFVSLLMFILLFLSSWVSSNVTQCSGNVVIGVNRPDRFVNEELAVGVLEEPVDWFHFGDELFRRDVLQSDAALQQLGRHAHSVFAVKVEPLQQCAEYLHLGLDVEVVVGQDAVETLGWQVDEVLRRRHL